MRNKFAAIAAGIALLFGASFAIAPSAQAVTWQKLGVLTDTTYVDDCTGAAGAVRVQLQWELSSDYKLRLDKDYDIRITNNSDAQIKIQGETNIEGDGLVASVEYVRLAHAGAPLPPSYHISNYNHTFNIAAHSSSVISVDNAARWTRMDGVGDSDPSPYNTPIATGSDPAVTFQAALYAAGGICGGGLGWFTEITNNAA